MTSSKSFASTAPGYRAVQSSVRTRSFADDQTKSFNMFTRVHIPGVIAEKPEIVVDHPARQLVHTVRIGSKVRYEVPAVREPNGVRRRIWPHECRIRRQTYSMRMLVNIEYEVSDAHTGTIRYSKSMPDFPLDTLPCMTCSEQCHSRSVDPELLVEDLSEHGGLFIVQGQEKVMPMQEQARLNCSLVLLTDAGAELEYRAFSEKRYRSTSTLKIGFKAPYAATALHERRCASGTVTVTLPFIKELFSPIEIFRVLGVETFEEMVGHVMRQDDPPWFSNRVRDTFMDNPSLLLVPIDSIQRRLVIHRIKEGGEREAVVKACEGLLAMEFFPNYPENRTDAKAVQLGLCVRKLLRVYYKVDPPDDRDDYRNRRMALSSEMLTTVFRRNYKAWIKSFETKIEQNIAALKDEGDIVMVEDLLTSCNVGTNLEKAIKNGNFSARKKGGANKNNNGAPTDGVTQNASRIEKHSVLSHVTRSTNPIVKSKSVKPRMQHPSCFGITDPHETPDGEQCGLVRHRSILAGLRPGYPIELLEQIVRDTGLLDSETVPPPSALDEDQEYVQISGCIVGSTRHGAKMLELLRRLRRFGDIAPDVSLFMHENTVHINGDAGAIWYPVVRVEEYETFLRMEQECSIVELWPRLVATGVVRYLCKDEEAFGGVRIAIHPRDIEPDTTDVMVWLAGHTSIFSLRNVLSNLNQSPRVSYASIMGRHAASQDLTCSATRFNATTYTMPRIERPLVYSMIDNELTPGGGTNTTMVMLGMLSFGSRNVEDSFVLNRDSLDRGMFRMKTEQSFWTAVTTRDSDCEKLMLPPKACVGKLHADYTHVDQATGIIPPGTPVDHNTVLISKVGIITKRGQERKALQEASADADSAPSQVHDRSVLYKAHDPGTVGDVVKTKMLTGEDLVCGKVRNTRVPELGDKCSCVTGDHDVLTEHGWISIVDVTTEDRVACLNPTTLRVEYCNPSRVWKYKVENQRMFKIRNDACMVDRIDLVVTPTHRLAVYDAEGNITLPCAEAIVYEHEGVVNHVNTAKKGWSGGNDGLGPYGQWIESYSQVVGHVNLRSYLWAFLGHLSSIDIRANDHVPGIYGRVVGTRTMVMPFVGDTSYIHRVYKAIPLPYTNVCENGEYKCHVTVPPTLLDMWEGGTSILNEAVKLPVYYAREFLKGYFQRNYYHTPRADIVDQIQTIAVHAGVTIRAHRRFSNDPYMIHMVGKSSPPKTVPGDCREYIKPYGHVYCLTVPTEIFCVRHKGVVTFTGNSRHGQKGVIGDIIPGVDMPFIESTGIPLDMLMNPHSIGSRMTNGHTLESQLGLIASIIGETIDGTPFHFDDSLVGNDPSPNAIVDAIEKMLTKHGITQKGCYVMRDGVTGRRMEMLVYAGPVAMQRLKHVVAGKFQARSRGPVVPSTGQPVVGRKKDGGGKTGEMERDAQISHGTSGVTKDRLMDSSDPSQAPYCVLCSNIGTGSKYHAAVNNPLVLNSRYANKSYCRVCQRHDTIVNVTLPCGSRLTMAEQNAVHIAMRPKFSEEAKRRVLEEKPSY